MRALLTVLAVVLAYGSFINPASAQDPSNSPYAQWKNGPPTDPDYFPIAVWLQPAKYVPQLKNAGVNLVIGVWRGPTEKHLADFRELGMPLICHQTEAALSDLDNPLIVGWLQKDEPDNAQGFDSYWQTIEKVNRAWPEANRTREEWGTYGPPVPPKDIIAKYREMRSNDPTRPVYLNLGQGVAYLNYPGRGYRRAHPDDYMQYVKGCDIVSFDLYAYSFRDPNVSEKVWLVPFGVDNLHGWSRDERIVWNFVEATQVYNGGKKPTPAITRAEVWMSIVHGSRGIIYYAHGQGPGGGDQENALVSDGEMMAALKEINAQVRELAPVINSPTVHNALRVVSEKPEVPVDAVVKRHDGATYVFAVCMRSEATGAAFKLEGVPAGSKVEVIDEGRTLEVAGGEFSDDFGAYQVHLYRIED